MNEEAPVALLWTSGWDSTFRLLDLVFIQGKMVQPYYVFDLERPSSPVEIRTMERIKRAIAARSPAARALIRETIVLRGNEAPRDEGITRSYERLRDRSFIGSQYDLLPRMAKRDRLERLELSVHIDDRLFEHLRGNVVDRDGVFELVEAPREPDLEIFRAFRFPILMLTKKDMEAAAREKGFIDLLELSWFCHRPLRGKPCGMCVPCVQTVEEGLGRRVPPRSYFDRVIYFHARRILRGLRRRLPGKRARA